MLADTTKIVLRRGGSLLELCYINSKSPLWVKCSRGHKWQSNHDALKAGDWCPKCAGRGRSRDDVAAIARARGGQLVSQSFSRMSERYLWRCEFGHEWEAVARNVVYNGRWCPECGRRKRSAARRCYSLKDLQDWARVRGGECLTQEFTSIVARVRWRCNCGTEWTAEARKIRDGGWCPECAKKLRGQKRRVHTPESLDKFAREKHGRCYPLHKFDVKTPIEWECAAGHHWMANADNIVNGGKWCPECAGNKLLTIEDMHNLARERHGKCLSKHYENSVTSLKWACSVGHQWMAIPSSIKVGRWCPICSAGLGERICRTYFEQLLETEFPKTRPTWLRSSDGNQLELDGFSSELALAFEHQGSHHYKQTPYFHRSKGDFKAQVDRDLKKSDLCKEHGIDLIVVPSVLEILGINDIPAFIASELSKLGRYVPKDIFHKKVDYSEAYTPNEISILQGVATQHGGELISTAYLGIFEKLRWRCSKGHEFSATPNNVKNKGSWCPICYGLGQTIFDMKRIAAERGGDCLSSKYVNNSTPLIWKCRAGHIWKARPGNVKFETWCPYCARQSAGLKRRKYDIDFLKNAARNLGGTCESKEYLGYKNRHRWRCYCGEEFEQTAERIIRDKYWCKKCKRK